MSGSKRRTGYRKTLQDDVLFGLPTPTPAQSLAFVQRASGANLFEVRTEAGAEGVALLPTKFRKLVWLKRGDFVILSPPASGATATASGGVGAVTHVVEAILYADALKHLRGLGRLPPSLEAERAALLETVAVGAGEEAGGAGAPGQGSGGAEGEEGEEGGVEGEGEGAGEPVAGGGGAAAAQPFWSQRHKQGPRDLPPEEEEGEEEEEGGGGGGPTA